jgi:hypothetical protein
MLVAPLSSTRAEEPPEQPNPTAAPQQTQDAPEHHHPAPAPAQTQPMEHHHEAMTAGSAASSFAAASAALLMNLASGTSLNPASTGMHAGHVMKGAWTLMFHGQAFIVDVQETGPRGEDQIFSPNWGMIMATRSAGEGAILLRAMLSLEPATIRQGFYPLLFQTGEVADGEPIVDGQHPHDFFMELAFAYSRPLGKKSFLLLYAAPVGDPALGPVAFPTGSATTRAVATLGHHLQVRPTSLRRAHRRVGLAQVQAGSVGVSWGGAGRSAVEHRVRPDRLLFGAAHVASDSRVGGAGIPRKTERARGARPRTSRTTIGPLVPPTASGHVTAGAIWGRNDLETDGQTLNSYLLEGNWNFKKKNYLFGRMERLDGDELFGNDPAQEAIFEAQGIDSFTVNAFTLGYTRDFAKRGGCSCGADATIYPSHRTWIPFTAAARTPTASSCASATRAPATIPLPRNTCTLPDIPLDASIRIH